MEYYVTATEWDSDIGKLYLHFTNAEAENHFTTAKKPSVVMWVHRCNAILFVFTSGLALLNWWLSPPAENLIARSVFDHGIIIVCCAVAVSFTGATVTCLPWTQQLSIECLEMIGIVEALFTIVCGFNCDGYFAGRLRGFDANELRQAIGDDASEARILLLFSMLQVMVQFLAPLRWSRKMMFQIWCTLIMLSFFSVTGLAEKVITNSFVNLASYITIAVGCSISARKTEYQERRLLLHAIREKVQRVQSEFKLEQLSEAEPSKRTPSTAIFSLIDERHCDDSEDSLDPDDIRKTQLQAMAVTGEKEGWRISAAEVELTRNTLGKGGFAVVLRGKVRSLNVAIKCPSSLTVKSLKSLTLEVRTLRHLRHPNIVCFHGCCILASMGVVLVVEELVEGGTLQDMMPTSALETQERYSILLGVGEALRYLHGWQQPVIHGDLKPGNILMDVRHGMIPKLVDFGMSQTCDSFRRFRGFSVRYAAPEVVAKVTPKNPAAADMFSFGGLAYFVLTGSRPGEGKNKEEIRDLLLQGRVVEFDWSGAHGEFIVQEFCDQCRDVEEEQRPSSLELTQLMHRLIAQHVSSGGSAEESEQRLISQLTFLDFLKGDSAQVKSTGKEPKLSL